MKSIKAKGGGEIPEDAYLQRWWWWHNLRFGNKDLKHNKKEYEIWLVNLIKKFVKEKISIFVY